MNTVGLRVVFSRVLWSAEKRKQHERNIGATTCRESPVTHESSKIICAAASSGSCLAQHSGQCTQEPLSAPFFSQVGIEHRSSPDPSPSLCDDRPLECLFFFAPRMPADGEQPQQTQAPP